MSHIAPNDDSKLIAPTLKIPETNLSDAERKRFLLRQMLLYSFVASVASELWTGLTELFAIPLLVMAVMWCFADAREKGRPLGRIWGILLLLAFAFVFPVYVFRTHGKQGFKVLFSAIVFSCLVLLGLEIIPLIKLWLNRESDEQFGLLNSFRSQFCLHAGVELADDGWQIPL